MSVNSVVSVGRIAYSGLTDAQRAELIAPVMSDPTAAMALMGTLASDEPVSDDHALALRMVRKFVLGLTTTKQDVTVFRPVRRGGMPQNLDAWLAGLNGSQIDPETVVYVRDADGNELTVTTTDDDGNEVETPLADMRGDKNETGEVRIRLTDGRVFTPADGRKVTVADCEGSENWHNVREFSRDGGVTWQDVRWTLTLPRPRKK